MRRVRNAAPYLDTPTEPTPPSNWDAVHPAMGCTAVTRTTKASPTTRMVAARPPYLAVDEIVGGKGGVEGFAGLLATRYGQICRIQQPQLH